MVKPRLQRRQSRPVSFVVGSVLALFLFFLLLSSNLVVVVRADDDVGIPIEESYRFEELPACTLNTLQLSQLPHDVNVDPCVLYHTNPPSSNYTHDLVVTNLIVTPTNCKDWRDGALAGVEMLNADNDGRGFAIGFHKDFYVGFRLLSVVAGNPNALSHAVYLQRHAALLHALLEYTANEDVARYIVGTCSFSSSSEPAVATQHETILAAQVGPPSYYNPAQYPWTFGIHVTSDDYPTAAIRKLAFYAQQQQPPDQNLLERLPVRVIYRTSSEFFFSTCESALRTLEQVGFANVQRVLYDPEGDADADGIANAQDDDFLKLVADETCPPNATAAPDYLPPAIFMCTRTEQDVILPRWRENGCLLTSLWMTPATWQWAVQNIDAVEYYQGAGQWHSKLSYGDKYFASGVDLLEYMEPRVGYFGQYDMIVSYAIPVLFAQHLQNTFRVFNQPQPLQLFGTAEGREQLRRRMLNLRVDTIFGTIQFDDQQRNNGRQSAAIQWQPVPATGNNNNNNTVRLRDALISPDSQAEAEVVLPAATASGCDAGYFTNVSQLRTRTALLQSVCSPCPVDTFWQPGGEEGSTSHHNRMVLECTACPAGTSTQGHTGAAVCTRYEDNLLSTGMLAFGYVALGLSWFLAIGFFAWIVIYRHDAVVRLAQIPFLLLICVGGLVSSASILGMTFQAGTGEDTSAASAGCKAAPILYSLGWVLQYGSLCAKTQRLRRIVVESSPSAASRGSGSRVAVTAVSASYAIWIPLLIDAAILTAWTVLDPLEYVREETSRNLDPASGILTIETIGRCRPSQGTVDVWAFLGPLFVNHFVLVAFTHWLLWKVRNISNRYQESKYLSMAAVFAVEVAIVGIPILIAAQDSVEATFFVITGIVALDNMGVLGFIFVPKVYYQYKGLEEGVSVGESILHDTHKQAVVRETSRKLYNSSSLSPPGAGSPQVSGATHTTGGAVAAGASAASSSNLSSNFESGVPRGAFSSEGDDNGLIPPWPLESIAENSEAELLSSAENIIMDDEEEAALKQQLHAYHHRQTVVPQPEQAPVRPRQEQAPPPSEQAPPARRSQASTVLSMSGSTVSTEATTLTPPTTTIPVHTEVEPVNMMEQEAAPLYDTTDSDYDDDVLEEVFGNDGGDEPDEEAPPPPQAATTSSASDQHNQFYL